MRGASAYSSYVPGACTLPAPWGCSSHGYPCQGCDSGMALPMQFLTMPAEQEEEESSKEEAGVF